MKPASYYVGYTVRKLWATVAVLLVFVAVSISILRYSLPYMDSQKHLLQDWLAENYGIELEIQEISATWNGLGPAMVLRNVQLHQNNQSPIELHISEARIDLSFWASITARQFQSHRFELDGLDLKIDMRRLQGAESDFPVIDALESLFLEQLEQFSVTGSQVTLTTQREEQQIEIKHLSWVNKEDRHQGVGQLQVDELANNSVYFVLDLYGNRQDLNGTFFAKAEELDLSPWVKQLIHTDEELVESRANFTLWSSIQQSKVKSVQTQFNESRFTWQSVLADDAEPDTQQNRAGRIEAILQGGQFYAEPKNDSWLFNLDKLSFRIDDNDWVSNWQGQISADGVTSLRSRNTLNMAPLVPLLPLLLDHESSQKMMDLAPSGQIDTLELQFGPEGPMAIAAFANLSTQQVGIVPGVSGLNGNLVWYLNEGRINLQAQDETLYTSNLLDEDVPFQTFNAQIYVSNSASGFNLDIPELSFRSQLLSFEHQLAYSGHDGLLSLVTNIDSLGVQQVKKLFPAELMGTDTKTYLSKAIQDGKVENAQLLWFGKPAEFPFRQNEGIFQALVNIENARFKFDDQWPALTDLNIELLFKNEGLWMTSDSTNMLDVQVTDLLAVIPSLDDGAALTITGHGKGSGQQLTTLMNNSSLSGSVGEALAGLQVSGPLSTDLDLYIPLSGNDVVAKGKVKLNNNRLFIPALELEITQTTGFVDFVNDKVSVDGVQGLILSQPVQIDFNGLSVQQAYKGEVKLAGSWQIDQVLAKRHPGFVPYVKGLGDWQANVDLLFEGQDYQYDFWLKSELTEVESTLPAPFAKSVGGNMPLLATGNGNSQASTIDITLGNDVRFSGVLPHKEKQFSRAHLAIGDTEPVAMGLGFSISANIPQLAFVPWYESIAALIEDGPVSDTPILGQPKRIIIDADNFLIAGQQVNKLNILAKYSELGWLLEVNAKEVRAEVHLYDDWLGSGIDVRADYINLNEWQSGAEEQFNDVNVTALPPISFVCQQCYFQGKDLGRIDFELSRANKAMKIDSVRVNSPNGLLYATGLWEPTGTGSQTSLTGEFSSPDFGAWLKSYGFDSGIKDSKARFSFELDWQRAPYEFSFDTLNGNIEWRLTDGYLTEVSDQGSRLFSILSLESLVRKLSLDFRDVFAKGFFYDKMRGTFQIANGVADTRDTLIDGGAGEMTIRGYTDLKDQELNYRIAFTPKVTSSLPVIVAWMVNPATALAALALDQMLTSAKVISNIEYSLTGNIEAPVLIELGRDSKDISLPAQNLPDELPGQVPDKFENDIPQTQGLQNKRHSPLIQGGSVNG